MPATPLCEPVEFAESTTRKKKSAPRNHGEERSAAALGELMPKENACADERKSADNSSWSGRSKDG
jgi:hypothetical protein